MYNSSKSKFKTTLPTLQSEERSEKCMLIVKRADEIRDQLELRWQNDKQHVKARGLPD